MKSIKGVPVQPDIMPNKINFLSSHKDSQENSNEPRSMSNNDIQTKAANNLALLKQEKSSLQRKLKEKRMREKQLIEQIR